MGIREVRQIVKEFTESDIDIYSNSATHWFRRRLNQITGIQRPNLVYHGTTPSRVLEKRIYLYGYDPKWKSVLPYYDTFPIVLILKKEPDGFIGLNFHYLPLYERAVYLNALLNYARPSEYADEPDAKIDINYTIAKGHKYTRPCVHKYLYHHIRSRVRLVDPEEWKVMLFLSIDRFVKATREEVWKESREKFK